MKFVKAITIFAVSFLFLSSCVFADSVLKVKPSSDQPEEVDLNNGEISSFVKMRMRVVPSKNIPVIIRGMTAEISGISDFVNRVAVILNKSPGVSDLEVGRVVANGYLNSDGKSVYLYPVHGDAVFSLLKKDIKMTVVVVTNRDFEQGLNEEVSLVVTNVFASWPNGSQVPVEGYLPIISKKKVINIGLNIGIVNEEETPYNSLKYSVPENSPEEVRIKKIFIYDSRENLKLSVQIEGKDKTFECKNNSYLTSCDFGGEGITIPPGSSVTITASEPNIFYQGFNTLDIFCEGEDSGRRIFVLPFSGGKG